MEISWLIIWLIILIILLLNIFVFFLRKKIEKLENKIILLLKKRNYQIISIYSISKDILNRHNEIFSDFLELKRRDFFENTYNLDLRSKAITNQMLHNEIGFIFKICDKNKRFYKNEVYNYIKDSIIEKSYEIWEYYYVYNNISKKYNILSKISRLTIIWILIWN